MLNKSIYKDRVDEARDLISEIEDVLCDLKDAENNLNDLMFDEEPDREDYDSEKEYLSEYNIWILDVSGNENKLDSLGRRLRGLIKDFHIFISDLNNDYSLVSNLRDKYVVGSIEYNGFDMQLKRIEKALDELQDLATKYDDWSDFS